MAYPVFDNFGPDRQVTGVILTTIFWCLLFEDVLPVNVRGVICVLHNTLGEDATYRIDGQTATLLGPGDLHDPEYDSMVVSRDISEFLTERASPESTSYRSVELDTGYTSYMLSVYPSQAMEDQYVTSEPIIYSVVVALVFVFTTLVFMLCGRTFVRGVKSSLVKADPSIVDPLLSCHFIDWLVKKRQKKVMNGFCR